MDDDEIENALVTIPYSVVSEIIEYLVVTLPLRDSLIHGDTLNRYLGLSARRQALKVTDRSRSDQRP